jgi:hypothetical protein
MEEFELKLRMSPSDNQFKKMIGQEVYDKLNKSIFKRDNFTCQGCGFHPLDESKASDALMMHVIEINEEKPEESPCVILCMACHSTQHIDISIEKGWVSLINSTYSQKSLIEMCRINVFHTRANSDDVRTLKTTPLDFLEKLKAEKIPANSKAKVIFTNKFNWGDL